MPKKEPATVTAAKETRKGTIIAAIITVIGVLVAAYWQFVLKPGRQNQPVETEYIGHVLDSSTLRPIANAKITLSLEGVPPVVYTDSEGVYRFEVAIQSDISGQIRVDAQGYQVYIRTITVSPALKNIEDIRLHPSSVTAAPTELPVFTPTPNATLITMYTQISTPNSNFTVQTRTIDGKEQVWVPEGSFVAGDTSGIGYDDEKPLHIAYTDGFWIDRNLVTNAEYANCPETICTTPQKLDSHKRPTGYYDNPNYKDYPVINITWYQARDYCSWKKGRLPTEAEFEKAAGWDPSTGFTLIYPWGDFAPTDDLANYNGVDRDTTPVGSYPKGMSPMGAYDVAGNVWEWVSDWYSSAYYSDNQEWRNPAGPEQGVEKVLRGGSWYSSDTRFLRVSNRGKSTPDKVANEFGFRCVYEK
jgi:formylglycine-generating enzyme required for sulfatase activity